MNEQRPSRMEQMLDLLIEEIRERLGAADVVGSASIARPVDDKAGRLAGETRLGTDLAPEMPPSPVKDTEAGKVSTVRTEPETEGTLPPFLEPAVPEPLLSVPEREPAEPPAPFAEGPPHTARLMRRLAAWLLIAIVLINVPLNRHGTTLATAMPDAASFVVRDGFVVKEEDDVEIYVFRDGEFRWISSLDAFEHYGFTWGDVHIVPDGYLDRYEFGPPLHVLLKCAESPHIYRLEDGRKRWIRDIDTFVAEGHVWEDVRFVSCQYLRELPDGETVPPGSGSPPQP